MIIKTIKTKIFRPKDNLFLFIEKYFPKIEEESILAITSKIVALAENRVVVKKDENTKKDIIAKESEVVLRTKYATLTIKDGVAMTSAGVDESNGDGKIILLPRDSFKTALLVRKYFCKKYKLKNLGVIITDSRSMPLRPGITGVALGYAGFKGLKKYKDRVDIFGRPFKFSRVDVADSLAASIVFCMGEGDEQMPLAIIRKAPVEYISKVDRNELKIKIEEDMYGPIFEKVLK